jgi:hypothetical protein
MKNQRLFYMFKRVIFILVFLISFTFLFNDSFAQHCTVFQGEQKETGCDYCLVGYWPFEGVPFGRVWPIVGYIDYLWIVCEDVVWVYEPPVRCTLGFDDCGQYIAYGNYIGKNCYGRRSDSEVVRTDSNDPYVPFSDSDHARCQVSSFGELSDCYNLFASSDPYAWESPENWGYWDADDKACVKCDSLHRKYWRAFSAWDYGSISPVCEEACGADPVCDEHPIGFETGYCNFDTHRQLICGGDCQAVDGKCDQDCGADSRCHDKNPGDSCGPVDGFNAHCNDVCSCMKDVPECTSHDDCYDDPNTPERDFYCCVNTKECISFENYCGPEKHTLQDDGLIYPQRCDITEPSYFRDKCTDKCRYGKNETCWRDSGGTCTSTIECDGKEPGHIWTDENGNVWMCNDYCEPVQKPCSEVGCPSGETCCYATQKCVPNPTSPGESGTYCGEPGTSNGEYCCASDCTWGETYVTTESGGPMCDCYQGTCNQGFCRADPYCFFNIECQSNGRWIGEVNSNKPDCSPNTWGCAGGADPDYCAQFSGDVAEPYGEIDIFDLVICNSHTGCLSVAFIPGLVSEGAFMICSSCPYFKNQTECEILGFFEDGEIKRNGGKNLGCKWQPIADDTCYYNGNAQCTTNGWVCKYASSGETVGSCDCSETHTCRQGYCQSGNTCHYNLDCGESGWYGLSESLDNKCENNIRYFDGKCTSRGVDFDVQSCSFIRSLPAFNGYEVWNYTCTPEKCEKNSKLYASDLKTFVNGVEAVYTFFSLSPDPVYAGETVTAYITGFEGYDDKTVYVSQGKDKVLRCWCTISGGKCSCSFTAPKPLTSPYTYTYYARIDLNEDGDYDDEGEEWSRDLTVFCHAKGEACEPYSGSCCAGLYCGKNGVCEPGGGCPVLKTWDGEEFKNIEKLNIHSREGMDISYSTSFEMKPYEKGIYKLILEEKWYALWEGSHIDHVKLTDSKGGECKLIEAIHSKLGNVLSLLDKSDDSRVETKPGESIELTFTNCEGNEFNLEIEGFNPWGFPVKMALSYTNIIIIGITVSLLVIIILMFKRFMVKK